MRQQAEHKSHQYLCTMCVGEQVEPARVELLKDQNKPITCKPCGNKLAILKAAQYTVVPINKSNYMLVTDMTMLKQLNPKRTM
jgi:DNA-directed RNA polymerase subunit RPC12/RpoP